MEDQSCLFYAEQESVSHLFFDCVVAKICWSYLNDIFHIDLGKCFESVARWWVSNNRFKVMNCCPSALLWSLWKTRNEICFQGKLWLEERVVIRKMVNMLRNWRILFKDGELAKLDQVLEAMHIKLEQPLPLLGPMATQPLCSQEVNTSTSAPLPGMAPSSAVRLTASEAPALISTEFESNVRANVPTVNYFEPP